MKTIVFLQVPVLIPAEAKEQLRAAVQKDVGPQFKVVCLSGGTTVVTVQPLFSIVKQRPHRRTKPRVRPPAPPPERGFKSTR